MAKLLSTFLLQMLFGFFTPCFLEIASTDHLSVRPGENVTLLCNITNYSEISWYRLRSEEVKLLISAEKSKLKKTFSLSYNVNKSHFDITESSSSVTLVIIGVRETDLGFYFCGGRNRTTHIQFGKFIRLDFTADQHHETDQYDEIDYSYTFPNPQHSGLTHCGIIIIILSCVCAVFVSISIICSSLYCSTLQGENLQPEDQHLHRSPCHTHFPLFTTLPVVPGRAAALIH
ncbi:uncharacterized protein LOC124627623 isoform X1 [Ictalurus punctatus]|uniref:Uncharacterized protein LOC124627623 isoform X1 n=1 Tax=Ictalurus punctatus TaxID=7998 RepID=A0A9F7TQA3_ICTPU|nr:uncharacterized protein LOC124627623 isoform X1 [Ictalurus punctatus]